MKKITPVIQDNSPEVADIKGNDAVSELKILHFHFVQNPLQDFEKNSMPSL